MAEKGCLSIRLVGDSPLPVYQDHLDGQDKDGTLPLLFFLVDL